MEDTVHDGMAKHSKTMWWYVARRDILRDYIRRYAGLPKHARILEAGCGDGHNLPMLQQFGEVDAIEIHAGSREKASAKLGKPVLDASLPLLPGIERGVYDMVAVLDVIEHIEDDVGALKAIKECLAPGGKVLIAVPAHMWMWSQHDVVNHHFRRYSKRSLRSAIAAAGLQPRRFGYFNSLLFVPIGGLRLIGKGYTLITGKKGSGDDKQPREPYNNWLRTIFALERRCVGNPLFALNPGVSIITLAVPKN